MMKVVALVGGPLDHRVLVAQVEDVVLVDPGRHDQQRTLLYWSLVCGSYWISWNQLVLEDDLARCVATFLPISKAEVSVMRMRSWPSPCSTSCSRLFRP